MNVGSSHTYKNRKVETTQFEDILVKKGIISERVEVTAERLAKELEKEAQNAPSKSAEEILASKLETLKTEDLSEFDDDDFDTDDKFIQKFREQRLKELKEKTAKEVFGAVYPIHRADFIKEVTEASKKKTIQKETLEGVKDTELDDTCQWVVVELFKDGIRQSSRMSQLINELAARQKSTKFVRIRSTECVENWPDRNVPCLFLYHKGVLQSKVIGLGSIGGEDNCSVDKLDWVLGNSYKVFATSCVEDPFKEAFQLRRDFVGKSYEHENLDEDDSDSDWS